MLDTADGGIDTFGNPGLRHRDTTIPQSDGATQPVDQTKNVHRFTKDLHTRRFRNPQQLQAVKGVWTVDSADLLDNQPIQFTKIMLTEKQTSTVKAGQTGVANEASVF